MSRHKREGKVGRERFAGPQSGATGARRRADRDLRAAGDAPLAGRWLPGDPDGAGCDENVTNIRMKTAGTFAASDGANHPGFSLKF
jgi:hypothetical protein